MRNTGVAKGGFIDVPWMECPDRPAPERPDGDARLPLWIDIVGVLDPLLSLAFPQLATQIPELAAGAPADVAVPALPIGLASLSESCSRLGATGQCQVDEAEGAVCAALR